MLQQTSNKTQFLNAFVWEYLVTLKLFSSPFKIVFSCTGNMGPWLWNLAVWFAVEFQYLWSKNKDNDNDNESITVMCSHALTVRTPAQRLIWILRRMHVVGVWKMRLTAFNYIYVHVHVKNGHGGGPHNLEWSWEKLPNRPIELTRGKAT